ncbi:MAG: hypothetical protein HYS27_22310 [Deltaproteobacteria bacterium]|nr:hypothetical protein [Deltaproteobacteria bacterium]
MHRSTLVVDDDDARRRQVVQALSIHGLRYLDVADAFGAMAALGRADFGVVVANEGRRTLSLRGLCQLARRRHPDIVILVVHRPGSDPTAIPGILGLPVEVLPPTVGPDELAAIVQGAIADAMDTARLPLARGSTASTSNELALDVDVVPIDDEPTVKTKLPVAPAPVAAAAVDASSTDDARADDPTVKLPVAPGPVEVPQPLPPLPPVPVPAVVAAPPAMVDVLPTPVTAPMPRAAPPSAAALVAPLQEPTPAAPRVMASDLPTLPNAIRPLAVDEPTERMAAAPSEPVVPDGSAEALLEGALDGAAGPALLMGVFAQELTGRLTVKDGPAAGTLYFYRGEPVWADDPLGDAGLHRRLVQRGRLKPDQKLDRVPQGQLLGSLVQKGVLTGQQMHEFMRELVRDFVLALANAASGAYRFDEDKKFLEVAPLLKVNPFGLILESRRRSMPPAELLSLSNDISDKFVLPQPGLISAADKIAPFVRGARLGRIVDGTRTTRHVLEATSLDAFMGTLVMITLRDAKLVSFDTVPHAATEGGVTLTEAALTDEPREITLVDAEVPSVPDGTSEEAVVREQIFALYLRLKPLTLPRDVLGVPLAAGLAEIEEAYRARMRELDPQRIPEGSAQQLLSARVEELARKVTSAYHAVKLQIGASELSGPAAVARKPNPF